MLIFHDQRIAPLCCLDWTFEIHGTKVRRALANLPKPGINCFPPKFTDPVFGSEAWVCWSVYPKGDPFFFNVISLAYVYANVVLSFVTRLKVYMKRKLSLLYLKEVLKLYSNLFVRFLFLCVVFEIFQFVWYANYQGLHTCIMTYRRRLYSIVVIKRNHFKLCMFGVAGETHIHDSFKVIL